MLPDIQLYCGPNINEPFWMPQADFLGGLGGAWGRSHPIKTNFCMIWLLKKSEDYLPIDIGQQLIIDPDRDDGDANWVYAFETKKPASQGWVRRASSEPTTVHCVRPPLDIPPPPPEALPALPAPPLDIPPPPPTPPPMASMYNNSNGCTCRRCPVRNHSKRCTCRRCLTPHPTRLCPVNPELEAPTPELRKPSAQSDVG